VVVVFFWHCLVVVAILVVVCGGGGGVGGRVVVVLAMVALREEFFYKKGQKIFHWCCTRGRTTLEKKIENGASIASTTLGEGFHECAIFYAQGRRLSR
jgi:hypothetical protein